MKIKNNRKIGSSNPCFIIAEAGVNHNGSIEIAKKLIDSAVNAGCDAVKFQAFKAEELVTKEAAKAKYQLEATDKNESQYNMLKQLELNKEQHIELKNYSEERGIVFLSSPFTINAVDMLDDLQIPIFKIPSGEITNLEFLKHVASKRKPIILSTGMADCTEIKEAIEIIKKEKNNEVVLLHCGSNYPLEYKDVNLRAIISMKKEFNLNIGYSDHTKGIEVAIAAVAMGACVIEKHFTLDKSLPGPDHLASLNVEELKQLVESIRNIEKSLGTGIKIPCKSELDTLKVARKSLVADCFIKKDTKIVEEMITIKRPGTGILPKEKENFIGKITSRDICEGEIINLDMFQ